MKKILDEEIKPLHETKVFILGISVPIAATILSFGLLIWTTGRHRAFNFSSSGFAEFFEIYRFPLWVLVGTAALTALSVALHRSRETAKQIEISSKQYQATSEKNNFENILKHKELFKNSVLDITKKRYYGYIYVTYYSNTEYNSQASYEGEEHYDLEISDERLYRRLFPKNKGANFFDFFIDWHIANEIDNAFIKKNIAFLRETLEIKYINIEKESDYISLPEEDEIITLSDVWSQLKQQYLEQ